MKTTMKIAVIAMMGIFLNVNAQSHHFEITKKSPYFQRDLSNQVAYIDLGDIQFWGYMEVTLTGGWSYQNTIGKYTKRYEIGKNVGKLYRAESEVPTSFGLVSNQWKLGEAVLNDNNHLVIPIYHLVSTGNNITINIKGVSVTSFNKEQIKITDPITLNNSEKRDYITLKNQINILGKVGIDDSSPGGKLSIRDGNQVLNFLTNKKLTGTWPASNEARTMTIQSSGSSAGNIAFATGNSEKMRVSANGNVGIGTNTPSAKLSVNGGIQKLTDWNGVDGRWDNLIKYGYKNDLEHSGSRKNRWHGIDATITAGGAASNKMKFRVYGGTNADLVPKDVMTLNGLGNVAIHGKLESKEIKVTTSPTADFVFEEDYNLPTLKSIEKHIKEKKHLPEIASAKEMEKNGVNVGNFQIQLLQKIEELTLYTIAQEKEIEELKKQNSKNRKQQEEIEELKKQNSRIKDLEILVQKLLKDKN